MQNLSLADLALKTQSEIKAVYKDLFNLMKRAIKTKGDSGELIPEFMIRPSQLKAQANLKHLIDLAKFAFEQQACMPQNAFYAISELNHYQ